MSTQQPTTQQVIAAPTQAAVVKIGREKEKALQVWDKKLHDEVDEDFFQDPKDFRTLHRVIDVLGVQLLDNKKKEKKGSSSKSDKDKDPKAALKSNPAFIALKQQQKVVEDAIEHMAVAHCTELNDGVEAVGRVSRQFSDAVNKVRSLRRQVRDIKDSLGTQDDDQVAATPQQSASKSLREYWLKKLECEAVLRLLGRLELIRGAPTRFDSLVYPRNGGPCRVGAGVVLLSSAIQTMFMDDVAQVQALHKIMDQLMTRKQKAEEIIWDTLRDVLFLRTGNPPLEDSSKDAANDEQKTSSIAGHGHHHFVKGGSVTTRGSGGRNNAGAAGHGVGLVNPFLKKNGGAGSKIADNDDDSVGSSNSASSVLSLDSVISTAQSVHSGSQKGATSHQKEMKIRIMIPKSAIEAELDLEADERRCLEESALSGETKQRHRPAHSSAGVGGEEANLPRYVDHVMALRVLIESLAKLGRLDDVERNLLDDLEEELRLIAKHEQQKTFSRLENRQVKRFGKANLKDFRRHLTSLLSAYGCIMIRLSHLAQILRHRIMTDPTISTPSYASPSSAMHTVLLTAQDMMNEEIKKFLRACLDEVRVEATTSTTSTKVTGRFGRDKTTGKTGGGSQEKGLFSLGILNEFPTAGGFDSAATAAATRANTVELPVDEFVLKVMFPKTNATPQVRHALTFRRSLAKWTDANETIQKELAVVSAEDTSSPSYNSTKEKAMSYLDNVIQKTLLPILQNEAVNGTISALERDDAFEPDMDNIFSSRGKEEERVVEMSVACQALYQSTGPLFAALHRLPKGGEMYLPLVAVLEHAILTFISRVKQRVEEICKDKMAQKLLDSVKKNRKGKEISLASIVERRKSFSMLLHSYTDGEELEQDHAHEVISESAGDNGPEVPTLSPHPGDTKKRSSSPDSAEASHALVGRGSLDMRGSNLEREEETLQMELPYLKEVLEFTRDSYEGNMILCNNHELMKGSCLAHSLLRLSCLLERRLRSKSQSWEKQSIGPTRALREAVKTIKSYGIRMAKFVRIDMLLQATIRMSKVCRSSTLVAKDAVRLPSSVNDLGEYLSMTSDHLRDSGGNIVAAYAFSSMEQFIPTLLRHTVLLVASGGVLPGTGISLHGIEALDRAGSVLYRDLKGAMNFESTFWDDEVAAVSFERSASFIAMMELEMPELEEYCRKCWDEFSEEELLVMFKMNAPRRRGDAKKFYNIKEKIQNSSRR